MVVKLSLGVQDYLAHLAESSIETIQDLTAHYIRRYLVELHRRELSSQYQHDLARAIRAFLNYCERDELLEKSPFDKVHMPSLEKKIMVAFSTDEIQRLL